MATETVKEILSTLGSEASIAELSTLRILDLIPEHQEDMSMAQPILDAAQDSFEELQLMGTTDGYNPNRYFSLANLLNFRHLSRLRIFRFRSAAYESDPKHTKVVDDMRIMLSRLPAGNCLDTLEYRLQVFGGLTFAAGMSQNWQGLAKEIVRVSAGRPFRFLFEMDNRAELEDPDDWFCYDDSPELRNLYSHVNHEMRDVKAHENIEWIFQMRLMDIFAAETREIWRGFR
ncbi:hypothetical protein BKA70DRAFT_1197116 [Coprinopsis sp. MPI-PUGE-AT-0042]|nr:hypothetical protein BKA70DRAFT_1197116 [Coprinopsis sp. MPI-PUGE-AT-0042]